MLSKLLLALLNAVGMCLTSIFNFFRSVRTGSTTTGIDPTENVILDEVKANADMQRQERQTAIITSAMSRGVGASIGNAMGRNVTCPHCGQSFYAP